MHDFSRLKFCTSVSESSFSGVQGTTGPVTIFLGERGGSYLPGFSCDKHGELLQACELWQMLLQRQLCQNYLHLKRAKNRTEDFRLLPTD